jgi:hypothetical protein
MRCSRRISFVIIRLKILQTTLLISISLRMGLLWPIPSIDSFSDLLIPGNSKFKLNSIMHLGLLSISLQMDLELQTHKFGFININFASKVPI